MRFTAAPRSTQRCFVSAASRRGGRRAPSLLPVTMLRNASQILVAAPAQDRLHILKQPIKIAGKPIIEHTIAAMQHHRAAQIVVT